MCKFTFLFYYRTQIALIKQIKNDESNFLSTSQIYISFYYGTQIALIKQIKNDESNF